MLAFNTTYADQMQAQRDRRSCLGTSICRRNEFKATVYGAGPFPQIKCVSLLTTNLKYHLTFLCIHIFFDISGSYIFQFIFFSLQF